VVVGDDGEVLGRVNLVDLADGYAVLGLRVAEKAAGRACRSHSARSILTRTSHLASRDEPDASEHCPGWRHEADRQVCAVVPVEGDFVASSWQVRPQRVGERRARTDRCTSTRPVPLPPWRSDTAQTAATTACTAAASAASRRIVPMDLTGSCTSHAGVIDKPVNSRSEIRPTRRVLPGIIQLRDIPSQQNRARREHRRDGRTNHTHAHMPARSAPVERLR
jgi:hypothetical protein